MFRNQNLRPSSIENSDVRNDVEYYIRNYIGIYLINDVRSHEENTSEIR